MLNEETTIEDIAINSDSHEIQNVHDQVLRKFEITNRRIEEAKQEIEFFYIFRRKSSKQCSLLEKDNYEDWHVAMEIMDLHADCLDMYTRKIKRALEIFENYLSSLEGNVSSKFLHIAEKTVEIFSSVQIKAENRMKEIRGEIEEMRNLESSDESE